MNERTVYRYFANERELRDAVMARLRSAKPASPSTDSRLEDIAEHTARILEYVSSFPLESRTPDDPTLVAAHRRQRDVLVAAVTAKTDAWPEADRATVAAMLDVLWSVASYERLVVDWRLEPDTAVDGVTWAINLVVDAINANQRPRTP